MTTKLKIDLTQGLLEVEGSESFVKIIYNDFKTHFAGIDVTEELKPARRTRKTKTAATPAVPTPVFEPGEEAKSEPESLPKEPAPPVPAYTLVKDLDLGTQDGRPSLVEFMDAKFPITNEERNIVFLYYLQYTLKLKSITPDHVYTCYRQAKIRAPLNLEHSLRLTANQHGWIRTTKTGKMTLTPAGKTYVEKQLPKRVKH
ncbi:MAG: hypothetical protein JW953_14605 [Anaerolineae bacterium]|nr:hypothetical protein [Anaerolineae bacterium]